MRLVSSPAMSFRTSGALTPAAHTTSSAGMHAAVGQPHAVGAAPRRPWPRCAPRRRACAAALRVASDMRWRQRRQERGRGLDQVDLDVLLGVDAVEPVGDELARGAMQLGRQLHARGAGADDRDVQLLGPQRRRLRVGADAGVDHARGGSARASAGVSSVDRVLAHAGRAEVVALAADRDDQRVVAEGALRRDLRGPRRRGRAPTWTSRRVAVEPDHLADAVAEAVPVRLREVVDLVRRRCPCCRRRSRAAAASTRACACLSISVTSALPRLRPSVSPSRVASSSPPAPPPTTTTRCLAAPSVLVDTCECAPCLEPDPRIRSNRCRSLRGVNACAHQGRPGDLTCRTAR